MSAYCSRLRKHSVSLDWYKTSRNTMLERLRKAGIDHAFVTEIAKRTEFTFPISLPSCLDIAQENVESSRHIWLTVPYHPAYAHEVTKAIRQISDSDCASILGDHVAPVIGFKAAWKLCMPSLGNVVRRY